MRLPDEQEERGSGAAVMGSIAVVSVLILIILSVVFMSNSPKKNSGRKNLQATPTPMEETVGFAEGAGDLESLYREEKLRSEDLEFWGLFEDRNPGTEVVIPTQEPTSEPVPSREPTEEELAGDGRHVLVSYRDGTREWLEINEDIPLHDYDFTRMKSVNGKMAYYEGNKRLSRLGVEISEENGEVNFEALKEAGIDFVMLRAGSRGYETGLLTSDNNFTSNLEKAEKAGLDIGVYFCSQAVTEQEAEKEAELVLGSLSSHRIAYPVAFRMDSVENDTSRTDILDKEERTKIADAFLNAVERAGYSVAVYGSKEWLLTEIEDRELRDRDIWLSEQTPVPDYPYQFKMWEYEAGAKIAGVTGEVNYTISFVDYTRR